MRDGLYHYVTGLPNVRLPASISLTYSLHARHQCIADRYGIIKPPNTLDMANGKLIEMEIANGRVAKIVVRVEYSAKYDLVLVVSSNGIVRTVWLNSVNDKHHTLDRSRYVSMPNYTGHK